MRTPARTGAVRSATMQFHGVGRAAAILLAAVILTVGGCNLFDPRDPEDPGASRLDYQPPTDPSIVLANLQAAIDQKNVANYTSCFSDAARTGRSFSFIPSADASAQYGSVFLSWGTTEEQAYFQNLIAKSSSSAYTSLVLTLRNSIISADSVVYNYDYIFTFEHSEPGFPRTARGNLQFAMAPDQTNFWSIYRWVDYQTGSDPTWSLFKGKFSN